VLTGSAQADHTGRIDQIVRPGTESEQVAAAIGELKAHGLCVLLCEQNLRFARQVADRACLIEQGRIVASGTLAAVQARYAVA